MKQLVIACGLLVSIHGADTKDWANWRHHPPGPGGPEAAKLPHPPVTQISGEDAGGYSKWVGGRLPTINEWETAAHAGAKTTFP